MKGLNIRGAFQPGLAVPKAAPTGRAAIAPDTASQFAPSRQEAVREDGVGATVAKQRVAAQDGNEDAGVVPVINQRDFYKVQDECEAFGNHLFAQYWTGLGSSSAPRQGAVSAAVGLPQVGAAFV